MKYPEQFFYDLYGKNIKYTMTVFALIVLGAWGCFVYIHLKHEDFLESNVREIEVVSVFNQRGVIFLNQSYKLLGTTNNDSVSMDDILVPGATLKKTEKLDSIVIIDINGKVHSFNLNDKSYW